MKKKLLALACLGILVGCSTKRDSLKNRAFHNSTAWFNTLFNAEEAMDKKIDELKLSYKDNYSEILPVDPLPKIEEGSLSDDIVSSQAGSLGGKGGSSSGSKKPAATGFDLVEQKALKAIEGHSMLIDGKERNKTMTRAYLVLGKAQYNNGKSFEALNTLNYLTTRLPFNKRYTPEARIYTALANIQTGNVYEAERILTMLNKDNGYKNDVQGLIAKNYAQFLINTKEYEEAIDVLDKAIDHAENKDSKARFHYIKGQLFSVLGMQQEAGEAFTKVYKMKPGFELEVKAQLAIAANFDPKKNSYNNYKKHLLDISKKGNYLSRQNEFYYAVGDMAVKDNRIDEAKKYLKESFKGPASDPYVRGKAYETYANLEFDLGNYVHASAYYDSALAVIPYNKDIERITSRSTSLKSLMEKYYLVKRNDSILNLANMTKEEKEKFFGDHIAKLKIEDEKRKKAMEEEATMFQTQIGKGGDINSTFGEGGGSSFYFYNTSTKANGQNEFKRIWGNTRLVDNWRSSTNSTISLEEKEAEMLGQVDTQNPRRYELEYYIEQIPTKLADLNKLKIERDTTELSLGIGYYDLFANAKTATSTLEHLVSTPPKDQSTEAQALYQIYRINNKVENSAKADEAKALILSKYPNSIYAEYILNPEVNYITPTTQEAVSLYEETYQLYKDSQYAEVKKNMLLALEKYPSEIIIAKFSLLNALSIGKTEGREKFIEALELITIAYQNTDEAKKAQEILDLLNGKNKNAATDEEKKKQETSQKEEEIKRMEKERIIQEERGGNSNSNSNSAGNSLKGNQSAGSLKGQTKPNPPTSPADGPRGPGAPGDSDD
jgi:hypothetical protein